jgi:hypothetical protein
MNSINQSHATISPTADNIYTLGEWLDIWLQTYKLCRVSEATGEIYSLVITLITSYDVGEVPVNKVTEMQLQAMLNDLFVRGYAKSTISKIRYTLRQCFRPLLRQHILCDDPSAYLELPNAPTKKVLPLTVEEQKKVEDACRMLPLGHLIVFSVPVYGAQKWLDCNGKTIMHTKEASLSAPAKHRLESEQCIFSKMPKPSSKHSPG